MRVALNVPRKEGPLGKHTVHLQGHPSKNGTHLMAILGMS